MLRVIFPQFVHTNLLSTYIIHLYQYYHIYEYQPDTLNNDQYFYTKSNTKWSFFLFYFKSNNHKLTINISKMNEPPYDIIYQSIYN